MIGVMIGVILLRVLPPVMTNVILLLVLANAFMKNYSKLKQNLEKERKQRQEKKYQDTAELTKLRTNTESDKISASKQNIPDSENHQSPYKNEEATLTSHFTSEKNSRALNVVLDKPSEAKLVQKDKQKDLIDPKIIKREILERKEQRFPFYKIKEMVVIVIIIVLVGLIRGSKKFKPVVGVEWTCQWDFTWFGIAIFLYLLCLIRSIYLVLKWQKEKQAVDYEFRPEEPVLNANRIIRLVIRSTCAGIIGAIVALGGSLIIGPALLDMKMPPAFSAATTGVFMIFSMFNTMFSTILNGKISASELAWFLPLSFVFSYCSSKLVNWYIKKTGKQSTIIILILIVTGLGFFCLLGTLSQGLMKSIKVETTFGKIC